MRKWMYFFIVLIVGMFFLFVEKAYSEEDTAYKSNVGIEFKGYEKSTQEDTKTPNKASESTQLTFPQTSEQRANLGIYGLFFVLSSNVIYYKIKKRLV